MTARDDEGLALRALQEGAQDYLVKGKSTDLLLDRTLRYAIERNLTRQALRDSEELFRGAFEHTGVAMVLTDIENRHLRVNGAFATMFGYSAPEMLGMTMADVTHPDDLAESLAGRERLMSGTEDYFQMEKRYRHRDGHTFWGLTNVTIVRDPAGRPRLYVGQVQNITDRKRAEGERDRLFQESRSLLGFFAFDGRTLRLNSAWERALGYTHDELMASPYMSFVHPDDLSATAEEVEKLAAGHVTDAFENRLRCQDGTYRTFFWTGTPLPDQNGFSVSGHDITEQRRADEALRLRDRAMQSVTQGILITDPNRPDNPIIYASPGAERMTGYRAEEIVGRNCRFLQGTKTDPETVGRLREAIREGRECTIEILNYRKDKTTFWNALFITPVREENGRLVNFVGVQIDISDRKNLEEQVRQAQKMEAVGQLAGGVAHDFNNLLTIISGYSEILLLTMDANDPKRTSVKAINDAGARAAGLTRQLLSFSRQSVLEPKLLDLNDVVVESEKMLRRLIGEDIGLTAVLAPGSVR